MRASMRLLLIGLSVLLLNFAFAPFNQFYLAWFGLASLLISFQGLKKLSAGFAIGFIAGFLFFLCSLTWMWHATFLGTLTLLIYLGIFWGTWGAILVASRATELLCGPLKQAILSLLTIASSFVMIEWARSWIFTGFGWIPLGQSQIPALALCQIAEFTGVYGVSFLLVLINGAVALWFIRAPMRSRGILTSIIAGIVLANFLLGSLMVAMPVSGRGPSVLVVQSNFAHGRGGEKLVTFDQQEEFHFRKTRETLREQKADLVVWSETVLPPMNIEARSRTKDPRLSTGIHEDLLKLVNEHMTSLVFGAYALLHFDGSATTADVRNSVYQYSHGQTGQARYDKIHLVPMGEIVPFKQSWPWAYNVFMKLAAYSVQYTINSGTIEDAKIFSLPTNSGEWKFITPICFEDIDGALIASLLRSPEGRRADFIVNITNDGWFNERQKWQHLQNAIFRSIENRVPMVRCCNTGVSAQVDPMGRMVEQIEPNREGVFVQELHVKSGTTFYTRYGDVFAWVCVGMTGLGLIFGRMRWVKG